MARKKKSHSTVSTGSIESISSSPVHNLSGCSYKCEQIDEFSLDKDHKILLDDKKRSELKFLEEEMLNKGRMNIDMLEGMEAGIVKHYDESLKKIFDYLMNVGQGSSLKEAVHGQSIVSRRGSLSRLAAAPYALKSHFDDNGHIIACAKFKGVYFLREFTKESRNASMNEYQLKTCYAGFKFEQLMTTKETGTKMPLDANPEHNGVFLGILSSSSKSKDSIKILLAAEVDCALDSGELIELKTQGGSHVGSINSFHHKALSWYLQSYMVDIQQLVVGLHEKCILHSVEKIQLKDLLKSARDGGGWNVQICMAFLYNFLAKVKNELDKLPEGTILVAERRARSQQYTFESIPNEDVNGQRQWEVITDEFKNFGWI